MAFRDLSLNELRDLAEMAATVGAAAEVGLFRRLHEGPATVDELVRDLAVDRRAVEILLPVLEELEFVEMRDGRAWEGPRARSELWSDEGEYLGKGLPLWLRNLGGWTSLPEVLRTGEPIEDGSEERSREDIARFMAGMAATPKERVERVVDACLARVPDARSILDLGGGPGHMARGFVERGLEATLVDLPEVVEFVGEEYGLTDVDELGLVGADVTREPLPQGPFDLVLVSNVCHIFPPETNRELLKRLHEVTAPGGAIAIADFLRGRSSRAARMGLVFLLRTEGGNTYTEEEYRTWLDEAGFRDPDIRQVDADRELITAVRPAKGS